MISRNDIQHDCPRTTVNVKYSTCASESQVIDSLVDFIRLDESAFLESFTVTTKTVARYDARQAARLHKIATGGIEIR